MILSQRFGKNTMDRLVEFEKSLFGEKTEGMYDIRDIDFLVDRLVILPALRPFHLERAVAIAINYSKNTTFRGILLQKASFMCPVLVYRLFKKNIFTFEDLRPYLNSDHYILCYYFHHEIVNMEKNLEKIENPPKTKNIPHIRIELPNSRVGSQFKGFPVKNRRANNMNNPEHFETYDNNHQKHKRRKKSLFKRYIKDFEQPEGYDESFFKNENQFDDLIEYGFLPSTIEYCLKYDVIDDYKMHFDQYFGKMNWSPFEWTQKPKSLDTLEFSCYFGSIKCFQHIIRRGFELSEELKSSMIYSGNYSRFICYFLKNFTIKDICAASEYGHLSFLEYFINNGGNLNCQDENGSTPLHYSVKNGHLGIVKYLVEHNVDLNVKNLIGQSPLFLAANHDHYRVVEYLISKGSDFSNKFLDYTYLSWASTIGNLGIVQSLIEKGDNINDSDNKVWNFY